MLNDLHTEIGRRYKIQDMPGNPMYFEVPLLFAAEQFHLGCRFVNCVQDQHCTTSYAVWNGTNCGDFMRKQFDIRDNRPG
jgi:hypothetical protein